MNFKKGDLIFINISQFADAVNQFRGEWRRAPSTRWTTRMAMETATAMATVTVTAMATVSSSYTVKNRQSGEEVNLNYYGIGWKELNQNLTGIVQEVVPEIYPDFDVFKVYCQQEGSIRIFRRYVLERVASRQPASQPTRECA